MINKILVLVGILLFFVHSNVQAATSQKYLFSKDEVDTYGARCLDGSPSGFYFTNATSPADTTKWQIFLQGGGFCIPNATAASGVDDCYQRAKGNLGSSNGWGNTSSFTSPAFASTWNRVLVPYCGGDLHSGTKKVPTGGLYYAGHLTIVAVITKLKNDFGLNRATELLFSGSSAGGIGVFINIDQVKSMLPGVVIGGYPDAGWFVEYPQWNPAADPRNRSEAALQMYAVANSYVNKDCAAALPNSLPLCMFAEFSWPYIQQLHVPFFIANSLFDTNQLSSLILNFASYDYSNTTENLFIVNFGVTMRNSTAIANIPINGLFLTSQLLHGIPFTTSIDGVTLNSAMSAWYSRTGNFKVIDKCTTPGCRTIPLPPTH